MILPTIRTVTPRPGSKSERDLGVGDAATLVIDTLRRGGMAVVPLDVAYGVLAGSREALERIYLAKGRPRTKPCGLLASWSQFNALSTGRPSAKRAVGRVIQSGFPLGVITSVDWTNPVAQAIPRSCSDLLVRDDAIALFLRMGGMADALLDAADRERVILYGSSANRSSAGNSFSLAEVPREILETADVICDGGPCALSNEARLPSTMINLRNGQMTRRGILSPEIRDLLNAGSARDALCRPAM